jgi:glyoxylase-like metal-dependent hydrolase (beta-lactamase superfamily II)
MYALLDSHGAAVVDPGLPGDENWTAVGDRLRQAGLRLADVHTVLVTHSHPDHFGGAARFREETGARVIAHRNFGMQGQTLELAEPEVSVDDLLAHKDVLASRRPKAVRERDEQEPPWLSNTDATPSTTPWGGTRPMPTPEQRQRWLELRAKGGRQMFFPRVTHVVEHGDAIKLCGREWYVVHTPGHTHDHFCLHDPDEGILLAGDHVLPSITPHISGLGTTEDPLQDFFSALDTVDVLSHVGCCLPAHGHPFTNLRERTDAIRRHHKQRLNQLKQISKQLGAPGSVQAFSQQLFSERSWGPMAESETYAHLEHLRLLGEAERTEADGSMLYTTDGP